MFNLPSALGLLPASGERRRSILLVADGYENTPPTVATVLPLVPAGVAIHTIALGSSSDQELLQNIAVSTGGSYFFSPDELGLFRIYNIAHGVTADADMLIEETVLSDETDDGSSDFCRQLLVEEDADFLDVSVAVRQKHIMIEATLKSISSPSAYLSRVARKRGPGYLLLHLKRPPAGIYELRVSVQSPMAVPCCIAAFVRSSVRLHVGRLEGSVAGGPPIDLSVAVLERGKVLPQLVVSGTALSPPTWVAGEHVLGATQDPIRYRTDLVYSPERALIRAPTAEGVGGTYTIRLDVTGRTSRGTPFKRVGYRDVFVAQ